jgi:FAD synthetase
MINKTVVIFGVFDGIHEGHLSFINEAKKQGNQLVAIVARDATSKILKGKIPHLNEEQRINALLQIEDIDRVLLGDPITGTYNILKEINPDIIFLGYDQKDLFENLNKTIQSGKIHEVEIVCGTPYKPETFHSSLLNKDE